MANGNTVFCNWTAGVKKPDWPNIVQVVEVTPQKKAVWAFREWTKRYQRATQADWIALLPEGETLARDRREALRALILTDPRRALIRR